MNYDSCNGIIYTINSGDSLYSISQMFGVSLEVMMQANPYADIYNLQVGDTLCLPLAGFEDVNELVSYVVEENDTIIDILNQFDIDFDDLMEYNQFGSIPLKAGSMLQIPQRRSMEE